MYGLLMRFTEILWQFSRIEIGFFLRVKIGTSIAPFNRICEMWKYYNKYQTQSHCTARIMKWFVSIIHRSDWETVWDCAAVFVSYRPSAWKMDSNEKSLAIYRTIDRLRHGFKISKLTNNNQFYSEIHVQPWIYLFHGVFFTVNFMMSIK